jgi:hypothetical protein
MDRMFKKIIERIEELNITDIDVLQEKAIEIVEQVSDECKDKYVSMGVYKQVAWERDIAIKQLHELGYEFGEKVVE